MKTLFLVLLALILLSSFFLAFSIAKNETLSNDINKAKELEQQSKTSIQEKKPMRYFSSSLDYIVINVFENVLYTNNPSTEISYYALDDSGNLVNFMEKDRAFVRILGITHLYTDNVEIFHTENPDSSKDNTLFSGKITIPKPGKYLIKVCLGETINLDIEGNMIWPFGCFEDDTSEVIDVYER